MGAALAGSGVAEAVGRGRVRMSFELYQVVGSATSTTVASATYGTVAVP